MNKLLSYKQKIVFLPILIQRDGGFICLYCKVLLKIQNFIFEHLNDDDTENRIWNLALSCQSCNVKKRFDPELRRIASEKLKENLSKTGIEFSRLEDTSNQASTEIEINQSNFEIVEQYLTEMITANGYVEFKKALDSCTYLCKRKTAHGAQPTIRNYFDALTSEVGPFMVTKDENKHKIIVRREN